jgi:hypothetical protein
MTAFTMLVANPIIQARVQAELDLVVGKDRLPDFSDRPRLPYLQCVITETLRWGAATPVGVPHRTSQDDTYRGFFIPANTTILANQWCVACWRCRCRFALADQEACFRAMLHDERVYPDPGRFNPDRFLAGEGRTPQNDPREVAFGFGRRYVLFCASISPVLLLLLAVLTRRHPALVYRICPGMDLAENTLWIAIASIFYAFRISSDLDAEGKPVPIDLEYKENSVR